MHKSSLALLFRLFFITFFLVSCSKDKVNSPPQTPKIEVADIKTLGGSKMKVHKPLSTQQMEAMLF